MNGKNGHSLRKGSIHETDLDGAHLVLSEDYYYKTEAYYSLVRNEARGIPTVPTAMAALEAYVVPICLEKAALAGIPVPEWGLAFSYVPLPSVLYGMNYYATPLEYHIVRDAPTMAKVMQTMTHNEKYPCVFERLEDDAEVSTVVSMFGNVKTEDENIRELAAKVHEVFGIPIVNIVLISNGGPYKLSALTPVRYSKLPKEDRYLLEDHLSKAGGPDG